MILITGGCGYIGSHIAVELIQNNYNVVIIDNLCNSYLDVIYNIESITGVKVKFYNIDMMNKDLLIETLGNLKIDCVIHCAGLKSVSESTSNPLSYYDTNINILLNLLYGMKKLNIKKLIFSSSATVYGDQKSPLIEDSITGINISSPYGKSKYFQEQIIYDYSKVNSITIVILRYFNPVGSHPSLLLGDNPKGFGGNLIPNILSSIINNNHITIFGKDYNTFDGTCLRDFIDIYDLANAHVKAYNYIKNCKEKYNVFNIGTGNPISVNQLLDIFQKTNNIKLNIKYSEKRKGDQDITFTDCMKANKLLKWKAKISLTESCLNAYHFYLSKEKK